MQTIVDEIVAAVRPAHIDITTPVFSDDGDRVPPSDAYLGDARPIVNGPRLNLEGFAFSQTEPGDADLTFLVRNVGQSTASKIWLFLPNLLIEELPRPIAAGEHLPRKVKLSNRKAYRSEVPISAPAVLEFEDASGNRFRQYGTPLQAANPSGGYRYEIKELDRPYLVRGRIIPDDDPNAFIVSR